ncbi:hypothetical protein H6F77_08885 [Microcoleus sp. FACHB-831]|nr:hypothetical protein [Microcoleus sp. FACHB-831]MBD1921206.1 hypothetical protein [Microcoleus sp. FACHB-831]
MSQTFLDAIARFDATICLIADSRHPTIPTFSPQKKPAPNYYQLIGTHYFRNITHKSIRESFDSMDAIASIFSIVAKSYFRFHSASAANTKKPERSLWV